jgi:hypothetical protein
MLWLMLIGVVIAIATLLAIHGQLQSIASDLEALGERIQTIAPEVAPQPYHDSLHPLFTLADLHACEDRLNYQSQQLFERLKEHEQKFGKDSINWNDDARQELLYPYSAYYLALFTLRERLEANLAILRGRSINEVERELRDSHLAELAHRLAREHVGLTTAEDQNAAYA